MSLRIGVLVTLLCSLGALADGISDRARLIGRWQLPAANGATSGISTAAWVFEDKGEALHITHSEEGQKIADFECNTMGRECKVKNSGHQEKVSMWYNGAKLVEIETKGSEVVKRRFAVNAAGDAMDLEVIPIVPNGKPVVLHFQRAQLAASSR